MPAEEKVTRHLFLHPQLSRMGEIVCSYTMTPADISIWTKKSDGSFLETVISGNDRCYNAWGSASLNLPHFRRIFNWQTLYGLDTRTPLADAGLQSYADMVSGIVPADTPSSSTSAADVLYDLLGRRVTQPLPGHIYIRGGRKIVHQ